MKRARKSSPPFRSDFSSVLGVIVSHNRTVNQHLVHFSSITFCNHIYYNSMDEDLLSFNFLGNFLSVKSFNLKDLPKKRNNRTLFKACMHRYD